MGTVTGYPDRVARSPQQLDDEQKRLLAALMRAHRKKAAAEAKRAAADEEYREALAACEVAGIPVLQLSRAVGAQRKTIYRQLGRKMP